MSQTSLVRQASENVPSVPISAVGDLVKGSTSETQKAVEMFRTSKRRLLWGARRVETVFSSQFSVVSKRRENPENNGRDLPRRGRRGGLHSARAGGPCPSKSQFWGCSVMSELKLRPQTPTRQETCWLMERMLPSGSLNQDLA